MPALQPERIFFDAPGGAALDFEPVSIQNGLALYTGQFASYPDGDEGPAVIVPTSTVLRPSMAASLQKPSKTSRISKTRIKIVVPQPVLVNDVATLAKDRENSIDITIMSSERSLPSERAQLVEILIKLLSTATFAAVAVDNKSIY